MTWVWDKTEAFKPGMSGDIAKLFRHEEPKNPGVFAVDAPPAAATLLAREVIQNSWDAARELAREIDPAPHFAIDFRFAELAGGAKRNLVNALDLQTLAHRVSQLDRRKIGLRQEDCLSEIGDDAKPLRILEIVEHGATGMYGPWDQKKSHMFLALVSLGYTEKLTGAGGSYGYGKAGLISGSRIRTVVGYTCFRAHADEPGITRRLLGMSYWGQHDIGDDNYTGFGSFSSRQDGRIEPFTNDDADRVAQSLDLDLRDTSEPERLGTSFLLIDPAVEPSDLIRAIERSWWPAIEEDDFTVEVIDYTGATRHPRPRQDEVLRSFIDAWELARRKRQPRDEEYASPLTERDGGGTVGDLGLVAELSGWSYADQAAGIGDDEVKHRSLVALTRGPRMVVEYHDVGRSQPYLRGTFIADESIDDILRSTEPKAHDAWRTKAADGEVDPEAAAMADHVIRRIKQTVNNHRTRLKPPVPPPEDLTLPFFNDIMRRVMSGMGPGASQPLPETRPLAIHLDHRPVAAGGDRVKIEGSAAFSLTDHYEGDRAKVKVRSPTDFSRMTASGKRPSSCSAILATWNPRGTVTSSVSSGGTTCCGFASNPRPTMPLGPGD